MECTQKDIPESPVVAVDHAVAGEHSSLLDALVLCHRLPKFGMHPEDATR